MVSSCMGYGGGVGSGIVGEGDGKKRRWGNEGRKKKRWGNRGAPLQQSYLGCARRVESDRSVGPMILHVTVLVYSITRMYYA